MDCWVGGRMVNLACVMTTAFPTDPLADCFLNPIVFSVVQWALASELFGAFLKMDIPHEIESLKLGLRILHC